MPSIKFTVPATPSQEYFLAVDSIHTLYVCEYGNRQGLPVVVCHGGPGAGSKPEQAGYFDPAIYRIILFDQRGAGKSTPQGELRQNTTAHLLADMEFIRRHLDVSKWVVFGGSWGSTLALLYAQAQPQVVMGLILRGIFLARPQDCLVFYEEGTPAALCYPKEFHEFKLGLLDWLHRCDLAVSNDNCENLLRLLQHADSTVRKAVTALLWKWEATISYLVPPQRDSLFSAEMTSRDMNAALVEVSYTHKQCFIGNNEILAQLHKIAHIPVYVVQGKMDFVCPRYQAFELVEGLKAVGGNVSYHETLAGHASNDGDIIELLLNGAQLFAESLPAELQSFRATL